MSNNNDQSSRQPSLSGQLDASPGKSVNNDKSTQICRDFIWGLCNKGAQCRYRHELDFEAMKKTLKFCHDFQNPSGCTREHCNYLHTSKEEESLFFATGTLPRVLAERHANITDSTAETIPQIALFIQESLSGAPPPPPPSTFPVSTVSPMAPRPTMPLQQMPPPPPPPPPPNASTVAPAQTNRIFAVPPPPPTPSFPITQPPPPIPMFDASRPPPSIPAVAINKNAPQKRPALNDDTVSVCKLRKTDDLKTEDVQCDLCLQREIRIQYYRQKMERIRAEDECQSLVYKKKLMEYQKLKDILRTLIDSDLFKLVEESLGDVPQSSFGDPLTSIIPSFLSGMFSAGPKPNHDQFLLQFMEYMFSKTRSFESSSVHVEESLRTLSTTPRRSHQSPDILQTLTEILGSSSERSVSEASGDSAHASGTNGVSTFRRFNRPRLDTLRPPAAATPATPGAPQAYPPSVLPPPPPPPPRTAALRLPNRLPPNPRRT
ncbi:hypothetical protein KGM_203394 [Danaus plexippus plexippus]|uniref:Uncharacterized protein n=1 Tax=Danaus plexippus plexippus TaxID=278856 RepID=A0A212EQH4_DANPL|nr:hypothetical protein KGM_203394 [Danaus plexippus plexippus]